MRFVRNQWYVAGWSYEFDGPMQRRELLGEPVVLFRREGRLHALQDRCPHRLLPLSQGRLTDAGLQCGYHGMTFAPDGRCVAIPGQDRIPPNARVRAFPVRESHGICWIWMGDPALADEQPVFTLPQFGDPGWAMHQGAPIRYRTHYINLAENLCDPAHVTFVHPGTLGSGSAGEDIPVDCHREGDVIVTSRWIRNSEPIGLFRAFDGFTGLVDRWHYYYFHAPATAVIDFGSEVSERDIQPDERHTGFQIFAVHFLTPVDATTTVDYWLHLRNRLQDDADVSRRMNTALTAAFEEDRAVLEAIQCEQDRLGDSAPTVRLAIDKGPTLLRRAIDERLAAESQAEAGS